MARFSFSESENYGTSQTNNYFRLRNDRDTAKVRYLINGVEDIEGYSTHIVQVGDKERRVNCLRAYNDPVDVCPFCAAKMKTTTKIFVPLYNIDEQTSQIWERPKSYYQTISALVSRYGAPLVRTTFEIERMGEPGDTRTTYREYNLEKDDARLEDFEPPVAVLGSLILDKSADEMNYYLDHKRFPEEGQSARGGNQQRSQTTFPRRTPSRSQDEDVPF